MKEYIKKFASVAAIPQNGYEIKDIPFITSVASDTVQNLYCNVSGKILAVGASGTVEVQTAPPEMVDLGLPSGTLWAKYNFGATHNETKESWYGGYYAWGELTTKETYTWENYRFGGNSEGGQTKYNSTDRKTVLDPEDDIVNITYGGRFTIPNTTDSKELVNNTNYEWVTNYNNISGLNGYKFTNKVDSTKFIFIPAAGHYQSGGSIVMKGIHVYLILSNLKYTMSNYNLWGNSNTGTIDPEGFYERRNAASIRPVQHVS